MHSKNEKKQKKETKEKRKKQGPCLTGPANEYSREGGYRISRNFSFPAGAKLIATGPFPGRDKGPLDHSLSHLHGGGGGEHPSDLNEAALQPRRREEEDLRGAISFTAGPSAGPAPATRPPRRAPRPGGDRAQCGGHWRQARRGAEAGRERMFYRFGALRASLPLAVEVLLDCVICRVRSKVIICRLILSKYINHFGMYVQWMSDSLPIDSDDLLFFRWLKLGRSCRSWRVIPNCFSGNRCTALVIQALSETRCSLPRKPSRGLIVAPFETCTP